MGYTHYWTQSREITEDEWSLILTEATRIVKAAAARRIVVCGSLGAETPVLDTTGIWLNGSAALGEDCESFVLERVPPAPSYPGERPGFSFCKTCHEPYDLIVVSILAAVKKIVGAGIDISSDGGPEVFTGGLL